MGSTIVTSMRSMEMKNRGRQGLKYDISPPRWREALGIWDYVHGKVDVTYEMVGRNGFKVRSCLGFSRDNLTIA